MLSFKGVTMKQKLLLAISGLTALILASLSNVAFADKHDNNKHKNSNKHNNKTVVIKSAPKPAAKVIVVKTPNKKVVVIKPIPKPKVIIVK